MGIRGIRGATTVSKNDAEEILHETRELLSVIMSANPTLVSENIASAFFTLTNDLDAVYPAKAARQIGWDQVPLICAVEIPVPGSLPLCIRVLIHWNTEIPQQAIQHVYLKGAAALRPDLSTQNTASESLNPENL